MSISGSFSCGPARSNSLLSAVDGPELTTNLKPAQVLARIYPLRRIEWRAATPLSYADMSVLTVSGLSKTYATGFNALKNVNLDIRKGEIFALLGPNGAGKTTLINIICGIVNSSAGTITADGFDIVRDFRQARARIGLVPQELATHVRDGVEHHPVQPWAVRQGALAAVRREGAQGSVA